MGKRGILAGALLAVAVAASTAMAAARAPLYTSAGTAACVSRQSHSVAGLPPATPPKAPALFFDAFTGGFFFSGGPQLGVWSGTPAHGYQGIVLEFFKSAADARKAYSSSSAKKLVRNVVAVWDGKPSSGLQHAVFGCLRGGSGTTTRRPVPKAGLATFAGLWGGHDRGFSITAKGGGGESANSGCCSREYQLAFRIRSVTGTLTRATAIFRVTSYKRYDKAEKDIHVGETGKLQLRNGIVTDSLTGVFFCSEPAWGATGACGA